MNKRAAALLLGGSVVLLLTFCGGDPGDLLVDAGHLLIDAGEQLGDGASGDAHAGTPTEISASCSTDYVQTITYSTGYVYKSTFRYAVVDVGDPNDLPTFWTIVCYPAGGAPACPEGATCTGSYPPAYYGDHCYLAREGGTFVGGKLHVSCGAVYETTPVGGPTTTTGSFASSVKVMVE